MSVSLLNDISRNVENIDLYERHVVRRIFLNYYFFLFYIVFVFFENFIFLYFVFVGFSNFVFCFFKNIYSEAILKTFFKKIREDVLAPQELGFACQFVELNSQTVLLEGL